MITTIFKRQLVLVIWIMGFSPCELSAQPLAALYDQTTGGVTFIGDSQSVLAGIRIESESGMILQDGVTTLGGRVCGALCEGIPTTHFFIEWGNLIGFTIDEEFAGSILPVGLLQSDLDADITLRYRFLSAPTVDEFATITAVPEPSTVAMAAGFLAALIYKRNRSPIFNRC